MFRTPRGDARFYHLDLAMTAGEEVLTLLIADRAGEEYMMVATDVSHVAPLFETRRADTLSLLVDGARLISSKERHNVRAEVEGIVQGLKDGGALNGGQRLAIVLTKNDAVQGSVRVATAMADFDRLVAHIRKLYTHCFLEIETFVTAASPKVAGAKRGEGLPELIAYWLKPPFVPLVAPVVLSATRDFERLKEVIE